MLPTWSRATGSLAVLAGMVLLVHARPPRPVPEDATALRQELDAARGELAVLRLAMNRTRTIEHYAAQYGITPTLAETIYDIALAEGVDPGLAFGLVKVESNFDPLARSKAGAVGYTQVLPGTARLYEPGLTDRQLYDGRTNLRLGFRYLRDLLERYQAGSNDANATRLALLAYNRGPARVEALLSMGHDPQNGYSTAVLRGSGHGMGPRP